MTKRSNELMAYVYSANYKLKTTGLRFFSVYGPCGRQDMAPWIFAESLLTNKSITLYNRGKMYRDFTFIDDIVDSIERVVVSERQSMNEVYNIGNSNPHSIIELVHLIEQEYKSESTIIEKSVIPGDVLQTHACMSKFKRDYNKDNFVDFAVGVNSFCIWLKEYLLFSSGLIGSR